MKKPEIDLHSDNVDETILMCYQDQDAFIEIDELPSVHVDYRSGRCEQA